MSELDFNRIREAFRDYRRMLVGESERLRNQVREGAPIPVLTVESGARIIIPKMERSKEFSELLIAVFGDGTTNFTDNLPAGARMQVWTPVHHFFRRSGVYVRFLEAIEAGDVYSWLDESSPLEDVFQQLLARKTLRYLSIAPIELVDFDPPDLDCLSFPGFSITRFSREELERNLSNWIRRTHYPDLVVDTAQLEDYWWISCFHEEELQGPAIEHESHFRPNALSLSVPIDGGRDLSWELPSHLQPFELQLRCLALHDWDAEPVAQDVPTISLTPMRSGGALFAPQPHVPLCTKILDSCLGPPQAVPVGSLRYGLSAPYVPRERVAFSATQEPHFRFDKTATLEFAREASENVECLEDLKDSEYQPWVDVMLGRLVLGMQSLGASSFLEYVIAIEATLGTSTGNVQEGIIRRARSLLGLTRKEQKALRKEFGEIYDLRSALVHGKGDAGKRDMHGRLREVHWVNDGKDSGPISFPDMKLLFRTRSLARRIVRKMLFLLKELLDAFGAEDPPDRDTILQGLDLAEATDRDQLADFLLKWPNLRDQIATR